MKINFPIALEKQKIWRYEDPPVLYDTFLQAHYPFKYPLVWEIENGNYEAHYRVIDANGKERAVVFADNIDTKEEAENRLDYDRGPLSYTAYDVTTHHNKAALTLCKGADGDLYEAAIYGRPVVLDLNRSCFRHDSEGIAAYGTAAPNVTSSYFSEQAINGVSGTLPHYEDWVVRELAERTGKMTSMSFCQSGVLQSKTPPNSIQPAPSMARREFTVKTHRGLFNAQVGAKVRIFTKTELLQGTINAFYFRYRKDEAFQAAFRITEKTE